MGSTLYSYHYPLLDSNPKSLLLCKEKLKSLEWATVEWVIDLHDLDVYNLLGCYQCES